MLVAAGVLITLAAQMTPRVWAELDGGQPRYRVVAHYDTKTTQVLLVKRDVLVTFDLKQRHVILQPLTGTAKQPLQPEGKWLAPLVVTTPHWLIVYEAIRGTDRAPSKTLWLVSRENWQHSLSQLRYWSIVVTGSSVSDIFSLEFRATKRGNASHLVIDPTRNKPQREERSPHAHVSDRSVRRVLADGALFLTEDTSAAVSGPSLLLRRNDGREMVSRLLVGDQRQLVATGPGYALLLAPLEEGNRECLEIIPVQQQQQQWLTASSKRWVLPRTARWISADPDPPAVYTVDEGTGEIRKYPLFHLIRATLHVPWTEVQPLLTLHGEDKTILKVSRDTVLYQSKKSVIFFQRIGTPGSGGAIDWPFGTLHTPLRVVSTATRTFLYDPGGRSHKPGFLYTHPSNQLTAWKPIRTNDAIRVISPASWDVKEDRVMVETTQRWLFDPDQKEPKQLVPWSGGDQDVPPALTLRSHEVIRDRRKVLAATADGVLLQTPTGDVELYRMHSDDSNLAFVATLVPPARGQWVGADLNSRWLFGVRQRRQGGWNVFAFQWDDDFLS